MILVVETSTSVFPAAGFIHAVRAKGAFANHFNIGPDDN